MYQRNKVALLRYGAYQAWNQAMQPLSRSTGHTVNRPTSILMELNNECIMRCKMCDIWRNKRGTSILSTEEKLSIIRQLREWLGPFHLSFCGGEGLMEKEQLCRLARYCAEHEITCDTTTAGLLLSERVADALLDSGLSQLNLSLDSLKEDVHDEIRGRPGTFKKVTHAISYILGKPRRMRLTAWAVISKYNVNELVGMVKWAHEVGLDGYGFHALESRWAYGHHEPFSEEWFKEHEMWPRDADEVVGVLDELIELQIAGYRVMTHPEYLNKFKQYYRDPGSVGMERNCYTGVKNLNITNTGEVKLCPFMPPVGNIREASARDIWWSHQADERRSIIKDCTRTCSVMACNRRYNLSSQFKTYLTRFSPLPH